MLARIWNDALFALRLLRKTPLFTATLVGVLAGGIAITTAMFSLVVGLLLRPLPYERPEELDVIWSVQPFVNPSPVSLADFHDWRDEGAPYAKMATIDYVGVSLTPEPGSAGQPAFFAGANVSGEFFDVLRLSALRGRLLRPEDDVVGGPRVAVISASLWHDRYGADPALIGRTIVLDGQPHTVVGVAPEGFRFSGPWRDCCDVWTPMAVSNARYTQLLHTHDHFLNVIGRRTSGVTREAAQARMDAIAATLSERHPDSNTKVGVRIVDLKRSVAGARDDVWILFIAVVFVFLVACANVANLLLARGASRQAEMAARVALGATRARLVGQMLTETVVLFLVAGGLGAVLARLLVDVLASSLLAGSAATLDVGVDGTVLAFTLGMSALCGVTFGLIPALEASRVAPQTVLKESSARASLGRPARLLRSGLVIAQISLAFALLAGGGLTLRAYAKLNAAPPGFDPNDLATARISLPASKYGDDARIATFVRELVRRASAEPGVVSVATNTSLPMGDAGWNGGFDIEGRPPWPPGTAPLLTRNVISTGYFATLGVPLVRGRDFTTEDALGGRLVTIISAQAATEFFPGEDPIGKRLDLDGDREPVWREIIGVVADVRQVGPGRLNFPESYVPVDQMGARTFTVVVRSPRARAVLDALPGIVASIDPDQATSQRRLMTERIGGTIAVQRFVTTLLAAFAGAALILATLGLFGLVSYTTLQRTRELGIRLALGCSPARLLKLVLQRGLKLLGAGLLAGLAGALLVGQTIAGHVQGASSFDPLVFLVVAIVLGASGLLAALLPALRTVRISPAIALRSE